MADAPAPDPPIDANNTEANRYLDRLARMIDSLQAGLKEAEEERDKLQERVTTLEAEKKDLQDQLDDAWSEDDVEAEAERQAKETISHDVNIFAEWGMEMGADPTLVRARLTPIASEMLREYALRRMDYPPIDATPMAPADKAAVLAAVGSLCEKGAAPLEVVQAYVDAARPPSTPPSDPALEGFA